MLLLLSLLLQLLQLLMLLLLSLLLQLLKLLLLLLLSLLLQLLQLLLPLLLQLSLLSAAVFLVSVAVVVAVQEESTRNFAY